MAWCQGKLCSALPDRTTPAWLSRLMETMQPRAYQQELIKMVSRGNNVIVSLDTGSGKTLIAAKVIQGKVATMRVMQRMAVFLAPTNPLVAQQQKVMHAFGLRCKAYHGNEGTNGLSSWEKAKWTAEWTNLDLLVMSPEVLLHILARGLMTMKDIGLLVFDECHHCHGREAYNQLMWDFCRWLPAEQRPQVLGLTASPEGMSARDGTLPIPFTQKGKLADPGLQINLNCLLLTAAERVHQPHAQYDKVPYALAEYDGPISSAQPCGKGGPNAAIYEALGQLESSSVLMTQAARCEELSEAVHKGQQLGLMMQNGLLPGLEVPDCSGSGFEAARVKKQIGDIKICLKEWGPWCAAAAAYLVLLAPSNAAAAPIPEHADGVVGMELATLLKQLMVKSELGGKDTETKLRGATDELVTELLKSTVGEAPLLTPATLKAAQQQSPSRGLLHTTSALIQLAMRVALVRTYSALAGMLVPNDNKEHLTAAFQAELGADLQQRGDGLLQPFAAVLMQQVPWEALKAQALSAVPSDSNGSWHGVELLTPKARKMLQCIWDSRQSVRADGWAAMVFVETKLSAMVLSRLISSLAALRPHAQTKLTASEFLGTDTMDQKAQQKVMDRFRAGIDAADGLNVLVATDVVSEGIDVRQCCLVLATKKPQSLTQFIQCRGRARAPNASYKLMHVEASTAPDLQGQAEALRGKAHSLSGANRAVMGDGAGFVGAADRDLQEADNKQRLAVMECLITPAGARVTLQLAQPLLMEYCAKLPGTEGHTLLQPCYYTRSVDNKHQCTVYLPSNSGLREPVTVTVDVKDHAKKSAALEALRQLRRRGLLNDHLQPTWGSPHSAQQLKSQSVPVFAAKRVLPSVLQPQAVPEAPGSLAAHADAQAAILTMQLHVFHLFAHQQLQQPADSCTASSTSKHESAPLADNSCFPADCAHSTVSFGVLLRDQLPEGLPAWKLSLEGRQCMVSVQHAGTVELQPLEVATLTAYQHVLKEHITVPKWLRSAGMHKGTAAGNTGGMQGPALARLMADFGFEQLQAACTKQQGQLQGQQQQQQHHHQQQRQQEEEESSNHLTSSLAYIIVPVDCRSGSPVVLDWAAVHAMAAGPQPALHLVHTDPPVPHSTSDSTASSAAFSAPAGQQGLSPAAVHAAGGQLHGRVLYSEHANTLWHCTGVSSVACGQQVKWLEGCGSHQELYRKQGYSGLRPDLPLLEMRRGRGLRQEACLKWLPAQTAPAPAANEASSAMSAATAAAATAAMGEAAPAAPGVADPAAGQLPANASTEGHVSAVAAAAAATGVTPPLLLPVSRPSEAAADCRHKCCLPLELCWVMPLPGFSWAQLVLVPGLMYRLEGLLRLQVLQEQLQQQLKLKLALPHSVPVPAPGLLLSVITPKRAGEDFSSERLEFLGDAVLKYLASAHLLHTKPNAAEGQLTVDKVQLVCNVTLAAKANMCLGGSNEPLHTFLRPFSLETDKCTPRGMASEQSKEVKGKCKADMVEALIGAFYLTAAAQEEGINASRTCSCVSRAGLAAAAQLCEALKVLPPRSSSIKAQAPTWPKQPSLASCDKAQQLAEVVCPLLGGYKFRRPALLQQALTYVSVLGAPSYQRLELLGDAVLDVLVSLQLLLKGDSRALGPGELTKKRAELVSNDNLARQAQSKGLHLHLKAQHRALPWLRQLSASTAGTTGVSSDSMQGAAQQAATAAALAAAAKTAAFGEDDAIWQHVWVQQGGPEVCSQKENDVEPLAQHKHKILADIVESVTAAVFVDSGGDWDVTWQAMKCYISGRERCCRRPIDGPVAGQCWKGQLA